MQEKKGVSFERKRKTREKEKRKAHLRQSPEPNDQSNEGVQHPPSTPHLSDPLPTDDSFRSPSESARSRSDLGRSRGDRDSFDGEHGDVLEFLTEPACRRGQYGVLDGRGRETEEESRGGRKGGREEGEGEGEDERSRREGGEVEASLGFFGGDVAEVGSEDERVTFLELGRRRVVNGCFESFGGGEREGGEVGGRVVRDGNGVEDVVFESS